MLDLILRGCGLPDRAQPVDLAIAGGRILGVGPAREPARETIDVAGRLVTPGLVESHMHLDKALLTGRISGSATIVGGIVYFSDLGSKTTVGLNTRTGKRVFFFPDGAFNPVVCDNSTIYLTGYSKLYQLVPKHR